MYEITLLEQDGNEIGRFNAEQILGVKDVILIPGSVILERLDRDLVVTKVVQPPGREWRVSEENWQANPKYWKDPIKPVNRVLVTVEPK